MKRVSMILTAGAALLLPAVANAQGYLYDFKLTNGVGGQYGEVTFSFPALITGNVLIPRSSYTSCNLFVADGTALKCGSGLTVYNDTTTLTSAGFDNYDAFSFGTGAIGGSVTYFDNGCFSKPGVCNSLDVVSNSGRLTISAIGGAVPEPATWAMMIAGFWAIGFALRRRRRERVAVRFA